MLAGNTSAVKGPGFINARIEEAHDTRAFVIRQIHRAEAERNWTEAAEWQAELLGVERELRALTAARGY